MTSGVGRTSRIIASPISSQGPGSRRSNVWATGEEIGEEAFGWNVPVEQLAAALHGHAVKTGVRFIAQDAETYRSTGDQAVVGLQDGEELAGDMVFAADGYSSRMRATASYANTDQDARQYATT